MLGKLIKYEWKDTCKIGCLLLFVVLLITLFGFLAFQTPMWKSMADGGGEFSWLDILSILTLIMYIMMLAGVNYVIMIYLGIHFYQTMYTDQGYLTHTLPVTKHQILVSKILISGLWILFLTLAVYLSVFILGTSLVSLFMPRGYNLFSLWNELGMSFGEFMRLLGEEMNFDIIRWLVVLMITSLVSPFVTVTILFGAISLGQLFGKHRVLAAILCYIGIMVAAGIVNAIIRSIVSATYYSSMAYLSNFGSYMSASMDSGFVINLLLAAGLYFVSWHVTSNRLNMQ